DKATRPGTRRPKLLAPSLPAFSRVSYHRPPMSAHAVVVSANDQPGLLFRLTKVFADHGANITSLDLHGGAPLSEIDFEFTLESGDGSAVAEGLRAVEGVTRVDQTPPINKIYGKRIVVM